MPRKRRIDRGEDMPPETSSATPESPAENAFEVFVGSVPVEAQVYMSLKRLPSYIDPRITEPEDLPPPPLGTMEAMQAEIRSRYGPGRYKLYVRYNDPERKKARFTAPTFLLAPTPEEIAAAHAGPRGDGADEEPETAASAMQETLSAMRNAARMRAQAAELRTLESLAGAPSPGAAAPSTLDQMKTVAEIIRALMPQTDPLTLLKNARDLIAPTSGGPGVSDTVSLVKELVGLARDFGGGGEGSGARDSFWSALLPHAADLLKSWGPYLPAVVSALRDARQGPTVPPAAPGPMLPASPPAAPVLPESGPAPPPPAEASWPDILAAVGNDARRARLLRTLLDLTYEEMLLPETEWPEGYERTLEFAEVHLPGFVASLAGLTAYNVSEMWQRLDPRSLHNANASRWVTGFCAAAQRPPEGVPDA